MTRKPTYQELEKRIQHLEQAQSEHKRIERELIGKQEKFRRIFNNILDVYYEITLDGMILEISPSIETHSKYKRQELIGRSIYDIYANPEDRDALIEIIINKGRVQNYEINLTDKDGSQHCCSMNIELDKDENDNPIKLIGIFRDITDLKQAEKELVRERTLTDAIFNSIPGMLYLYDENGKLIRWNKKHEILTGYSSQELSNMQLQDWYRGDPESQKAVEEGIKKTMESGFGEAEANLQKKDGTTIPFYFTACPLTIDDKQYFTGIGIDITERRRAEEAREKLQAQLNQAQKMEAVGRLAGGVAHDFNNMLSVIIGNTELAMGEVDPSEPICHKLKKILNTANRSANITRQLLAFARKQTIAPKVLDLNATVEKMLSMLQRLIGEDIDLAWFPASNVLPVRIDPSQTDQILANLCVNARDAIRDVGKLTIETGMVCFDDEYCLTHKGFVPGDYVLLAVSDDGCGMDKETLDNLFEPFYTTKEMGKGTGLGLATVYGIVKQNGGFINVYSEPGQGTVFKIYLPHHVGESIETLTETTAETPFGQGETILIVEDEKAILEVLKAMLEGLGYTILDAATPSDAIRQARTHPGQIHLLITDVVMPEMNGRDLASQLNALHPNLKLLFMSGYTANVIAHQGILDEGVQFINKPFSKKDIAIKVRDVLDERK